MKIFRFVRILAAVAFACLAHAGIAQGVYVTDNVWTSSGNAPPGAQSPMNTVPYAKVTICAYPAIGSPCTNTVPIYSDQAMTTPITQPLIADRYGRYEFFIGNGTYSITASSPSGVSFLTSAFTAGAGNGGGVVLLNPGSTQQVTQPAGTSLNVSTLNNVVDVASSCPTPGVYDQTCLTSAVAKAGNGGTVMLSPRVYTFTGSADLSGLVNVTIQGRGEGSVIKSSGGQIITCTNCTNVTLRDIRAETTVTPTALLIDSGHPASSVLPTANPALPVTIRRFSTASYGYVPTINDQDIVPVTSGGTCVSNCLSALQVAQSFPLLIQFTESDRVHVEGVTGLYVSLECFDCTNSMFTNNNFVGGSGFAGIGFWSNADGNFNNSITNNIISASAYNGISLASGQHWEVVGNLVAYNGESGIKTYQNTGRQVEYVNVTGNESHHNYFDGLDLSGNYPHNWTHDAHSLAVGNNVHHNGHTGVYSDGLHWTMTGNTIISNATGGMLLDLCDSLISGNMAEQNGTLNTHSQISIGGCTPGKNIVTSNVTDTGGGVTNGLYAQNSGETLIGNREISGSSILSTTGNILRGNSDGSGSIRDTAYTTISPITFQGAGTTALGAFSGGGAYTITLPGASGTVALQSGYSGSPVAGSCTFSISNGIITNVTGC